jgi:hypothetical protein
MIENFCESNIISSELVKNFIDYYNNQKDFKAVGIGGMNKTPADESYHSIKFLIEEKVGKKLELVQGNYYFHRNPYLPHTDFKNQWSSTINVVIPLMYHGNLPYLIVFDQIWELDSVTWCMHYPVQYFEYNIGVKGAPYEYPVQNLTKEEIDNDFYQKYLSFYPKELLYGLSGEAFPFEPGSIILFSSKKIHCTSKMSGAKLGLTLRFK